jgi:hypothetical protein
MSPKILSSKAILMKQNRELFVGYVGIMDIMPIIVQKI